jgi:hypothetical protein
MKISNKTKIAILIFGTMISAIIVQSFSLNMNYISTQTDYANLPPDLERFTIQKINEPLSTGENVIIRPTFSHFDTMPQILYLFTGQDSFAFMDDGAYPDDEANDHEYAAFMQIDINDFLLDVENREIEMEGMEQFMVFEGHDGHFEDTIPPFDFTGFNGYIEVDVAPKLILADQCDGSILKQNSLFITHLDVVEDPNRTYNPTGNGGTGSGTPNGIWTFGRFMTNMANTSGGTGRPSTSSFIKNWLKSYLTPVTDPNLLFGNKPARTFVLDYLIRPWISKANGRTAVQGPDNLGITLENWETKWDDADDAELIKNAPFKLTAIVNRLDQRNNVGYTNKVFNAGETRFIFTLINLYVVDDESHDAGAVGDVPRNVLHGHGNDFIDWKGMNVIFEFGNVQTNLCDLKSFGQAWLNLSGYNLTDEMEEFRVALEDITETVINANAVSGKPNGSALNQLRTNEKVFSNTVSANLSEGAAWDAASWQFRQFEISNITHHLTLVPLSNTPINEDYNASHNTQIVGFTQRLTTSNLSEYLTEWAYKPINQILIKKDKHKIPLEFNSYTLLDKAANVDAEYSFYWDLVYYTGSTIPYYNPSVEQIANNTQAKENGKLIRHHLSLNTCQGCHSGETKTLFTMVTPLGIGNAAEYWTSPPHTTVGRLDVRDGTNSLDGFIVSKNNGTTVIGDQNTSTSRYLNYPVPTTSTREFVSVSPFITGRNWDGSSWADDETDVDVDKIADSEMNGFYFVNDPGNVTDPTNQTGIIHNYFGMDYKRNKYNELELRKTDLCRLVQLKCNNTGGVDIMDLIRNLSHEQLVE